MGDTWAVNSASEADEREREGGREGGREGECVNEGGERAWGWELSSRVTRFAFARSVWRHQETETRRGTLQAGLHRPQFFSVSLLLWCSFYGWSLLHELKQQDHMQQGVEAKLPPFLSLLCSRKEQERDALTLGKSFRRRRNITV